MLCRYGNGSHDRQFIGARPRTLQQERNRSARHGNCFLFREISLMWRDILKWHLHFMMYAGCWMLVKQGFGSFLARLPEYPRVGAKASLKRLIS
jgi:hypothetical protein